MIFYQRAHYRNANIRAWVLAAIEAYQAVDGFAPSYKEIAALCGISETCARSNVVALARLQYIHRQPGRTRRLQLAG